MKVKDMMHAGVDCVAPETSIRRAAAMMRDNDIGAIPVRKDGRLIGMITDRDIATRAVANGKDIAALTVKSVMSKRVYSCRDTSDVGAAARLMQSKKVRRLPVLNKKNALVGMLSLGDISHALPTNDMAKVVKAVSAHHR